MSNVREDLVHGFPQKTIFDSLNENDLTFSTTRTSPPPFSSRARVLQFDGFWPTMTTPRTMLRRGQMFTKEVYEVLRKNP
ncbi:Non-specific phospholipase C1, partial [Mucuna pruriens]